VSSDVLHIYVSQSQAFEWFPSASQGSGNTHDLEARGGQMASEILPQEKGAKATITCPNCRNTSVVDTAKYKHAKSPTKAKCGCGCIFEIPALNVESRKFFRKKTNLTGSYSKTQIDGKGIMRVKDLSFSGLGFEIEKENDIKVDDVLGVRFILTNKKKTEIRRTVVVKNVRGRFIGAEFCDSQIFDMDLGYFLMLS
jgi:hypothetical protein